MYHRYMAGSTPDPASAPQDPPPAIMPDAAQEVPLSFQDVAEEPEAQPGEEPAKKGGLLQNLFGGSVKLPDVNADTVLLLVLVYFLVSDESENISDTLLIIGVLLLLGF